MDSIVDDEQQYQQWQVLQSHISRHHSRTASQDPPKCGEFHECRLPYNHIHHRISRQIICLKYTRKPTRTTLKMRTLHLGRQGCHGRLCPFQLRHFGHCANVDQWTTGSCCKTKDLLPEEKEPTLGSGFIEDWFYPILSDSVAFLVVDCCKWL